MSPSVLLLSAATHWFAQARMPRCLARAGFAVSVLAPRGSLAEKSRFVKKIGAIPENTTSAQWMQAFAGMANSASPTLVLPCDDTSYRLMQMLVHSPPPHLPPAERPLPVRIETGDAPWVGSLPGVFELLVAAGLVIVLVLFMLLSRRELRDRIIYLFGTRRLTVTTKVLDEVGARISRYLLIKRRELI